MASISFFSEKIPFKLSNPRKTSNWLKKVCLLEKQLLGSIQYIFCSDDYLLGLNKQYLNHATYTDILSFDFSADGQLCGEIYISIKRVRENARKYEQPFEVELRRVMVHGILHFIGYKDKSATQKAQMRRKEEACLSSWK